MDDFGDLLLHDKFPMVSNQVEREYTLFLFQRIMLCCKDVVKKKKKKGAKEEPPSYSLKGNIYITSIGGVVDTSKPEQQLFGLQVFWKDGTEMETFALNCRNIEQVKLWMDRLEKLVELERNRRRSQADGLSNLRNRMTFGENDDDEVEIDSAYSSGVSPTRGRRRSDAFGTDLASSQPSSSASSPVGMSRSRSQGRNEYPARGQWENNPPPPMLPEEYRNRKSSPAAPRSTSISTSSVEFPPRGQSRPQSEHSRGAVQRPPQQQPASHMEYEAMMNNLSAMQSGRGEPRARRGERGVVARSAPQVSSPQEYSQTTPYQQPAQRSIYQNSRSDPNALSSSEYSTDVVPTHRMTASEERMTARLERQQQASPRMQQQQETYQPRRSNRESNQSSSRPTSHEAQERESVGRNDVEGRLSARMQQLKTTPPIATRGPASPSAGGSMIKVKTHYGSDIFVVAVSSHGCSHAELYTKIERKIRLCGAELPEGRGLKMRYRDITGDLIILGGDEDVEEAFDVARMSTGRDSGVVSLFIQ
jgi:cell division control protein 24